METIIQTLIIMTELNIKFNWPLHFTDINILHGFNIFLSCLRAVALNVYENEASMFDLIALVTQFP